MRQRLCRLCTNPGRRHDRRRLADHARPVARLRPDLRNSDSTVGAKYDQSGCRRRGGPDLGPRSGRVAAVRERHDELHLPGKLLARQYERVAHRRDRARRYGHQQERGRQDHHRGCRSRRLHPHCRFRRRVQSTWRRPKTAARRVAEYPERRRLELRRVDSGSGRSLARRPPARFGTETGR